MRTIKFRAWDEGTKQMVYDVQNMYDSLGTFLNQRGEEVDLYQTALSVTSFGSVLRNGCPVMQFTDLLDMNEKEIYEGDILRHPQYQADYLTTVIFEDGIFTDKRGHLDSHPNLMCESEIIGNIYENPELLK